MIIESNVWNCRTFVIVKVALCLLWHQGGDGVGGVAPGLADLLAVVPAAVTRAPTVGHTSGGAHPGAGHQGPPRQHLNSRVTSISVLFCSRPHCTGRASPGGRPPGHGTKGWTRGRGCGWSRGDTASWSARCTARPSPLHSARSSDSESSQGGLSCSRYWPLSGIFRFLLEETASNPRERLSGPTRIKGKRKTANKNVLLLSL